MGARGPSRRKTLAHGVSHGSGAKGASPGTGRKRVSSNCPYPAKQVTVRSCRAPWTSDVSSAGEFAERVLLLSAGCAALIFIAVGIERPVWLDEANSALIAARGFGGIVDSLRRRTTCLAIIPFSVFGCASSAIRKSPCARYPLCFTWPDAEPFSFWAGALLRRPPRSL